MAAPLRGVSEQVLEGSFVNGLMAEIWAKLNASTNWAGPYDVIGPTY